MNKFENNYAKVSYNHLMFAKTQLHKAKIVGKLQLNYKTIQLDIKLTSNEPFLFEAGQYVNLKLFHKDEPKQPKYRAYSIASDSNQTGYFSIVATVAHDGIGANFFKNAKIGDELEIVGPSGRFVLNKDFSPYMVFIATGTGIVPFMSMFQELARLNTDSTVRLYFGVRHEDDLFFVDQLTALRSRLMDFDFKICVSRPKKAGNFLVGRVTSLIDISSNFETDYYLCGNPDMVEEMESLLNEKGVTEDYIYREKYTIAGN